MVKFKKMGKNDKYLENLKKAENKDRNEALKKKNSERAKAYRVGPKSEDLKRRQAINSRNFRLRLKTKSNRNNQIQFR